MQLPDLFKELSAICTKYKIKVCPLYKIHPSFLLHHTHFYSQTCFKFTDMRGQVEGDVRGGILQLPEVAHSKAGLEEDSTYSTVAEIKERMNEFCQRKR